MRKRFAFATAIVCAAAIITTIPFSRFILPSTAVVAQQQQTNSNTSSSQGTNSSSSNPLSLNSIFKQVRESVVQITSKLYENGWLARYRPGDPPCLLLI
jgi:hypothetical protein